MKKNDSVGFILSQSHKANKKKGTHKTYFQGPRLYLLPWLVKPQKPVKHFRLEPQVEIDIKISIIRY